jgi:hypothetical protein
MIIERERRVNTFIFRLLVHLFLSDKKTDTMDSQILEGCPLQILLNPLRQSWEGKVSSIPSLQNNRPQFDSIEKLI